MSGLQSGFTASEAERREKSNDGFGDEGFYDSTEDGEDDSHIASDSSSQSPAEKGDSHEELISYHSTSEEAEVNKKEGNTSKQHTTRKRMRGAPSTAQPQIGGYSLRSKRHK